MARTEYGNKAAELIQAIEKGPPYLVRFSWAGGNARERAAVTDALADCLGVRTLGAEQFVEGGEERPGPLADRVRFLYWLLKIHDLSLGFTHGREQTKEHGEVYRITIRIDRSRRRGYEE